MKSKMKLAFALIAVALMVMVAVVPMIGVFTSDSDAARPVADTAIVDPDIDDNITVKVIVNDKVGTPAKTGTNKVKITYGSYSQALGNNTTTTGVTFYLEEAKVASATISFVDKDGNQINSYPPVTITDLIAGNTYNVTLQPDYLSQKVKFQFANSKPIDTALLGTSGTFTGGYTVYSSATATEGYSNTFTSDSSLEATILYPVSYTNVYVKITSFTANGITIAFPTTQAAVTIGTSASTVTASDNLLTIAPSANIVKETTVAVTGSYGTDPTPATIKTINDKILYGTSSAYFVTDAPSSAVNYEITLTAADGSQLSVSKASSGLDISLTAEKTLFGTLTVNTKFQAGNVSVLFPKQSDQYSDLSYTLEVDAKGVYMKFLPDFDSTKNKTTFSATFTSGSFEFKTTTDVTYNASTASNITLSTTDWKAVDVTLKVTNDTGAVVKAKEIKVSEAVFGSTVTNDSGVASFLAKVGNTIGFSVDGATLSGDVSITVTSSTNTVKVYIPTKTVTVKVVDASGKALTGVTVKMVDAKKKTTGTGEEIALEASTTKGNYTAEIREDIAPETYYYVYLVKDGYTFVNSTAAKATAYTTTAYASKSSAYVISIYKADGTTPIASKADQVTINYAKVYKNSTGSFVYSLGDAITPVFLNADGSVSATTGVAYGITATADVMKATSSSVTTTPIDVVILRVTKNSDTAGLGIFENVYILTANSDNTVSIVASTDSFSGKLTRIDGKTPIAGIKVEIFTAASETAADVAYTQADGSFELFTDVALVDATTTVVKFTDLLGVYTFDTSKVYKEHKRMDAFKAKTDAYTFSYVDADNIKIALDNTVTKKINNANIESNYAWKAGDEVTVTMTKDTKPYRTFGTYTLTADDVASGEITFVSEQSTYVLEVTDANGKARNADNNGITFKAELEGIAYGEVPATIPEMKAVAVGELFPGMYTFLVTDLTNKDLLAAKVTGFAVKTLVANYGLTNVTSPLVAIDDEVTEVIAPYGDITYYLRDAAGERLLAEPAAGTVVYKDGELLDAVITVTATTVTFINDPEADYAFTIPASANVPFNGVNYTYTFAKMLEPEDGVLVANEEWVFGDIVDAVGNPIGIQDAEVQTFDILGMPYRAANYYVSVDNGNYYKMLVDVDEISALWIANNEIAGYTFDMTDELVIAANEQPVYFSAITANGFELPATFTAPAAYTANGQKIGKAILDDDDNGLGIIVDVDEVAYFQANSVDVILDYLGEYTFDKQSLLPIFISNESYLTGSVPWSGKDVNGYVELDFYLESSLVFWTIVETDGYEYEAAIDLSGRVVDGVAFDSLVATYYENGVEFGSAIVDPSSPVNNIISPIVEMYVAELLPPSVLIASHVDIDQIGDVVTVTADANFMIADDEGVYTDGQYTYTFAGWYVNNQKVSTSPVYTFELTDNVVISPQYTVTYEKTSDANDKQTPQPQPVQPDNSIDTNVLIIGICAVIVALIAVVYAVIKKE